MLILERYGLQRYVLGHSFNISQYITGADGVIVDNLDFLLHKQQDKLLASWLLSTICDDVLVYLTTATIGFVIWLMIERRFATRSSVKLFSLRHMIYSQKKGQMTIKEYMPKINQMCDVLAAAGSGISDQE